MTTERAQMMNQPPHMCSLPSGGFRVLYSSCVMRHMSLAMFVLLSSCASDDKPKSDYAGLKWEQRINRQMKDPNSISSPFQREVFQASRSVKTQEFRAHQYQGKKGFSGADDRFKAGTFAQAGKASHAAGQTFSGADDQSKMGSTAFKTSQSQYDGKANRNAGKASSMADDTYNTAPNPAALKAASKSKRPLIQDQKPSYSEEEVRKILNKG